MIDNTQADNLSYSTEILSENEIPTEVVKELSEKFGAVTFSRYGSDERLQSECTAVKANFKKEIKKNVDVTYIDPKTFEVKTIAAGGDCYEAFYIRGKLIDELFFIYSVASSVIVVKHEGNT